MSSIIVPGIKLSQLPLSIDITGTDLFYYVDVETDISYKTTFATISTTLVPPIQEVFDGRYLKLAGGQMTGALFLETSPIITSPPLQAATKEYVDSRVSLLSTYEIIAAGYLPLSGGTLTGHISTGSLAAPGNVKELVNKGYVDTLLATKLDVAGGTVTPGFLTINDPINFNHAATKAYVDRLSAAAGSGNKWSGKWIVNNSPGSQSNSVKANYTNASYIQDNSQTLRLAGLHGGNYNGGWGPYEGVTDRYQPVPVALKNSSATILSCWHVGYSTLLLDSDGVVYGAGYNGTGILGQGYNDYKYKYVFSYIDPLSFDNGSPVRKLVFSNTGYNSKGATWGPCFAITQSGKLYGWGTNYDGALGIPNTRGNGAKPYIGNNVNYSEPQLLFNGNVVTGVYGSAHQGEKAYIWNKTFLTDANKMVWCTGDNSSGALGLGDTRDRWTWSPVNSSADIIYTTGGGTNAYALTGGKVYGWGPNNYGQLGTGQPAKVRSLTWQKVLSTSGAVPEGELTGIQYLALNSTSNDGAVTVIAVDSTKTMWGWGYNGTSPLGLGDTLNRSTAVRLGSAEKVMMMGYGGDITTVILSGGDLFIAGKAYNYLGVGDPSLVNSKTAQVVSKRWAKVVKPQNTTWRDFWLYTGGGARRTIVAADSDYNLYATGANRYNGFGISTAVGYGGLTQSSNVDFISIPYRIYFDT